jgi:RimJ/RimL family protein N-acetyltransferase
MRRHAAAVASRVHRPRTLELDTKWCPTPISRPISGSGRTIGALPAITYPDPPLAGEAFVLRRFRTRDFDAAVAAREDPEAARWVNPIPFPGGAAMARYLEGQRRRGTLLHFAIADAAEDDYLGEILLFIRSPQAAELDIGEIAYVVAPAARGRGIAAAAVRLLTEWAFSTLGLARLQLSIAPENTPSIRVAEKALYRYEGLLRSLKVIRGQRVDSVLYSRLPADA